MGRADIAGSQVYDEKQVLQAQLRVAEELDTEVVETDWSGATGPPYGARYHRPDTPGWDRDDRASHEPDRGWDLYENHGLPLGMPT